MQILKRDGEEVFRGSWIECYTFIHRKHSFSFDWALAHEGYSVEPDKP